MAGRLHTARSRNDIDMTMYRMRQRDFVLGLIDAALPAARRALIDVAGAAHRETDHGRAHAHAAGAAHDAWRTTCWRSSSSSSGTPLRLQAAFETTNRNPLGACAITGTGFPIDRDLTSRLLGFDAPTGNTYGSIATVDYLLESTSAAGDAPHRPGTVRPGPAALGHGGGELRQPRRRVRAVQQHHAAEAEPGRHRARARDRQQSARTGACDCAVSVHNTPFGDIVDTEDDLQPLVWSMFRDAMRTVRLVAAAMQTREFDAERLEARAGAGRDDD